jgi:glutamyl-tRNA synthetase
MAWLGLNADEEPIYQTHRFDRYKEVAEKLLDEGKAYRCYCTKERLETLRTTQLARKQKPRYDGACRGSKEKKRGPYVIRFKNPQEGSVSFDDKVCGPIEFKNIELDDLIIVRSDGSPTYNFTVVVDDMDMKVTHVIRGSDHINNTPRQINIFEALKHRPPIYAHVPMILGPDGKKLSKRHGSVSVMQYREDGILPQALLNYLVRLGWSHGDQEIFSMKQMTDFFDLSALNKSPAIFNHEKLLWLNQHYLKTDNPATVALELKWHFDRMHISVVKGPDLADVIKIQAERCKTLKEIAEKSRYFYEDIQYNEKAAGLYLNAEFADILEYLLKELDQLESWDADAIHPVVIDASETFDIKLGKVAQPLRVAVTGDTISPPIDATLELLGKKRSLQRIGQAVKFIHKKK